MSSWKTLRRRRNRRGPRSLVRVECLEQRLPLAGNVTAELSGSTLRLTGDSLGNEVVVASVADGRIAILGITTTINGSPTVFLTNRAVTAIIANLEGGDDAIDFGNSAQDYANSRLFADGLLIAAPVHSPAPLDVPALQAAIDQVAGGVAVFSIPGSLTVTTAGGDDTIGMAGNVRGSVTVNLGSADFGNALVIASEVSDSRVGGSVTVVGGGQTDIVALGDVTVVGRVSAALGDGYNWMIVAAAPVSTIGSFTYVGGANTDVVGFLGEVTVRNEMSILTGSHGEDEVVFEETVKVRGSVVVNTGTGNDNVAVAGDIRGSLSVTTGSGEDTVAVSSSVGWTTSDGNEPVPTFYGDASSSIGRDLTVNTGAGDDLITIGTSSVGRNATIDAGLGNDRARIENLRVKRNVFVLLGAGDDALDISNVRAGAVFLEAGPGAESLSTAAATRGITRRLNPIRFQAGTSS